MHIERRFVFLLTWTCVWVANRVVNGWNRPAVVLEKKYANLSRARAATTNQAARLGPLNRKVMRPRVRS